MPGPESSAGGRGVDPILAKRARAARLAEIGRRIGYALFGLAIVVFMFAMFTTFTGSAANIVIGSIIVGSIFLAPAIIAGYAVKAAIRDDLEHGRPVE